MLRKDLRRELERIKVEEEVILAGFEAYDYLSDPDRCSDGAARGVVIADATCGPPTMGWNPVRFNVMDALSILEHHGVLGRRGADAKYEIRNVLE